MPLDQTIPQIRTIYGLIVASDIDLPELALAPAGAEPDLVIRRGEVPLVWKETDTANVRTFVDGSTQHLWLNIPGNLRMEVRGGRELIYAVDPASGEDAVRLFLLGSGLGAILMQRGFVVVHGNAITLPDAEAAIICVGDSGAGKSTTAIAMMQRGYSILADDVCPIGPSLRIEPGMPRAKIWDMTARLLNIDITGLRQIAEGAAKYNLPLEDRHCTESRQIGTFVWLVPGEVDAPQCCEVTGVEKFVVLRNNIYRPEYLVPLKLEGEYLKQVARIAAQAKVYKITRPLADFDIDPLLDMIALLYDRSATTTAHTG